ncbi:glycine oxidase (plasmid) [Azospirillum argentinense]|uniref:Glycine oxidase n=1 Tax=Azospirillum argentinense TaxID=2970906 RepID=A0A060DZW6_9PROT|nr:glycine oxidase ThiO [Azospirillum argentinense]AIB16309.1 glycine oxidase [Azospirillum argentinense]EZQ02550.1 glycine oxidase [Azospirillum argentinense]KAA1056952.1 Glycine oxidase ThiO [Azospirillum argentinense]
MVSAPSFHSDSAKPTVAVVGAGVIGLSIAWRLAAAGCRVEVFDRGAAGRGASHAAGGMLAACVETEPGEESLLPLTRASQNLWPAFAAELEAASGMAVDLRDEGTMVIALNADDAAKVRFLHDFQTKLGLPVEWLSGAEVRRREPYLQPGVAGALFCAGDHQVDNRKVAAALHAAALRAGAVVHEYAEIGRIEVRGGRAVGVQVGDRLVEADHVVLAAGAWSGWIDGLSPAVRPPVRPVKGQMLCLRMDARLPLLRHVVWTPGTYLIPRLDGRLLVGATTEERGFDDRLTAGGQFALLEGAWRALPGIAELPIEEAWAGFRPGTRDDAPILGLSEVEGLVYATGHHRNGILLTPVTADSIARLILTGEADPVIRPFALDRFAQPRGAAA